MHKKNIRQIFQAAGIGTLAGILILLLSFALQSCNVYSFTGGSTGNAKTFSVDYFQNKSAQVNPALSQMFTDKMKDRLQRQTRLSMVNSEGDFAFSGYIVSYVQSPSTIDANNQANRSKLTITVNVKFHNKLDPKQDFEQQFSNFSEFNVSTQTFADAEPTLVNDITDKLTQDIFNRTINNW
jgi:hypothetical protein